MLQTCRGQLRQVCVCVCVVYPSLVTNVNVMSREGLAQSKLARLYRNLKKLDEAEHYYQKILDNYLVENPPATQVNRHTSSDTAGLTLLHPGCHGCIGVPCNAVC